MSTIMQETRQAGPHSPTILEFDGDKVNYSANIDLRSQLREGENTAAGWGLDEGIVLVVTNVDDEGYSNVEVRCGAPHLDTIDAAIEALISVRDTLRKLAATARRAAASASRSCSAPPNCHERRR